MLSNYEVILAVIRDAQKKVCDIVFELVSSPCIDLHLNIVMQMLYNLNFCLRNAAEMCRSNIIDRLSEEDDDD